MRTELFRGLLFTFFSKYSGLFIGLVISAILARVLSPSEFGVVAIAMVFITLFNLFGNLGLGSAIIQANNLDDRDVRSLFLFSILIAFLVSVLFFFSSYMIADFYEMSDLTSIFQILSVSLFFTISNIVPQSLLYKKLLFRRLSVITFFVQLFSGVVAVYLAYNDFGYFSLVYRSVFVSVFTFLAIYFYSPIIPYFVTMDSVNKIAGFSLYQFLFTLVNYFSRNLDNILIGKYMGSSKLGYYDKSYYLMSLPIQNLTQVLTPVLHPILAKANFQSNEVFLFYLKACRILAAIGFPLSIFLFYSAEDIILLIYGDQWLNSIPVFKVLSISVGIQIVLSSSGSIFQSCNRTDLLFYSGLFTSSVMILSIFLGVFFFNSLVAISYCLLAAFVVNFFVAFYILIVKVLDSSYIKFLYIFVLPISSAISLFLIYYLLDSIFTFSNLWNLGLKAIFFLSISLGFFLISKSNRLLTRDFFIV